MLPLPGNPPRHHTIVVAGVTGKPKIPHPLAFSQPMPKGVGFLFCFCSDGSGKSGSACSCAAKSMPSMHVEHGLQSQHQLSSKKWYLLNEPVICCTIFTSAVSPGLEKAGIWVQAVLAWHASAGM